MTNNEITQSLIELGFDENEAKIYLACLNLGQSPAGKISKSCGVQRTFVYDILAELIKRGIASVVEARGMKYFNVISVDKLKGLHERKLQKFEKFIPELRALEKIGGDRPKVRFFEGREGLLEAQYDTLNLPKGSEILAYATSKGLYYDDPDFARKYIEQRINRQIGVRAIVPDTEETKKMLPFNKDQLRTSKVVPFETFPFTNEIDIYGNKVSIMSYVGELIAVVIESESIAKTQRMIFELAWLGAEKISTK